MFAPWRSQNPVRKTWVSDYWKIIHCFPSRDARQGESCWGKNIPIPLTRLRRLEFTKSYNSRHIRWSIHVHSNSDQSMGKGGRGNAHVMASLRGRTQEVGEFNKAKSPGSRTSQWKISSRYLPHLTWIHFIEGTFYDSLYATDLRMIVNKDSRRT